MLSWTRKVPRPGEFRRPRSKARKMDLSRDFWEACCCCCECESPKSGVASSSSFVLFCPPVCAHEKDGSVAFVLVFYLIMLCVSGREAGSDALVSYLFFLSRCIQFSRGFFFHDPLQCSAHSNKQSSCRFNI